MIILIIKGSIQQLKRQKLTDEAGLMIIFLLN